MYLNYHPGLSRSRGRAWAFFPALLFALSALLFLARPGETAPATAPDLQTGPGFVVNTADDVNDGACNATHCSLREAINAANADSDINTITFAGDYTITLDGSRLPTITTPVIINGTGEGNTIIQASTCNPVTLPGGCTPAAYRVLDIGSSGVFTGTELTIRHGNRLLGSGETFNFGGGIYNAGTVMLTDVTLSSNQVSDSGIFNAGGGIYNVGTATLIDVTLSGNTAGNSGGGIYNGDTVTLTDVIFDANQANGSGGGLYQYIGTATLHDVIFSGNTSGGGGGFYNGEGTATLTNVAFSNNQAGFGGGGIYNDGFTSILTLVNANFSNNQGGLGGGILNNAVNAMLTDVTLSGNTATSGGGIYNNTGTATLTNVTLSGNTAETGGGISNLSKAELTNVTLGGNTANDKGGGIHNDISTATLTLVNTTLSGNAANGSGGGLYNGNSTVTLINTIVADSTTNGAAGGDCVTNAGIIHADSSNNLIEDAANACGLTDGVNGNIIGQDPQLGPLADNGGSTQTMLPAYDSPAVDAGKTVVAIIDDQRGVSRPQSALYDIGAVEVVKPTGNISFIKAVEGGSAQPADWRFTLAGGPSGATLPGEIAPGGAPIVLQTGTYTLTESGPAGYVFVGAGGACSFSGGDILLTVTEAGGTCTVTNRATAAVSFAKTVEGGSAQPADWRFTLAGGPSGATLPGAITPGGAPIVLQTGTYTLTESGPAGYAFVGAGGACSFSGGDILLTVTEAGGTCTVTNRYGEVQITESYLVSRVEEGLSRGEGSVACYWITLSAPPGEGQVTVEIGQPQNGQVRRTKGSVTLDKTNWNSRTTAEPSNFVCIRPVDDAVDDGGAQICKDGNADIIGNGALVSDKECGDQIDYIAHRVSSASAPGYSTATPVRTLSPEDLDNDRSTVDVLVQDNDDAGVTLTESYAVSDLDEDGSPSGLACYWVTLTSQPTAPVIVSTSASGIKVQPASVTLDASNYQIELGGENNRICLRPVDNQTVESGSICAGKSDTLLGVQGAQEVCGNYVIPVTHSVTSGDAKYNGLSAFNGNGPDLDNNRATLDVLIRNDDVAGVLFQPSRLNLVEGQAGRYGVRLTAQPAADVTVTPVDGNLHAAEATGAGVTFTPSNWNQIQYLAVSVPENDSADGTQTRTLRYRITSNDPDFAGLDDPATTLWISDNDTAGLHAEAIGAEKRIQVSEAGASAGYNLTLTTRPSASVVVTVDGGDQVTALPSRITFTPENWNTAQSVTLNAVDDSYAEGPEIIAVRHGMASDDETYRQLVAPEVEVEIEDNDLPGLLLAQADDLRVSENGISASYTLQLGSKPRSPVTIRIDGGDRLAVQPDRLTISPESWNLPQSLTVSALDNQTDEGEISLVFIGHAVTSEDAEYAALAADDIAVAVEDNDQAAVWVSADVVVLEPGDQEVSYTIVLATRPTADVLIDAAAEKSVVQTAVDCHAEESACLRFTPENWRTPQTVTVIPGDPGEAGETITHLVSSSDPFYGEIQAPSVRIQRSGSPIRTDDVRSVYLPFVLNR